MSNFDRVYVIQNTAGQLYIGFSDNVPNRVNSTTPEHRARRKGKKRWRLLWFSIKLTLSQARTLELKLKRQKGADGLYKLTGLTRNAS